MNSKEDIKGTELLDMLEQSDNPALSDFEALLSDERSAEDARIILEYRLAKAKSCRTIDTDREWKNFAQRIQETKKPASLYNIRNAFYAVATVAAAVLIAFLVTQFPKQDDSMLAFESNNAPKEILMGNEDEDDMEPIKPTASIVKAGVVVSGTKADFSKIKTTSDEPEMKTISTPRGKDYELVLSDGTVVLLNADSKITFPTRFTGNKRTVKLVGEAYFKVSKNKHRPFIVETGNLYTKVLGTEFNLKAYPHSDVNVTLIKGSVAVNAEGKEVMLKPGENAEYSENKDIEVTTVDTEGYIQWKDGYFYFDNVPLIDVVRDLGRWYNVNIEIRNNSLMSYRLHFIASRKASIKEFVDNLNEFNYLHVVHKDNKLIIDRKK
ncbi:FecR domain-containing protein [Prevotella sp.]|uniref:FecR family protein n=1 Tax=uncultured Prevotella sp. TaxID=159272 RepID=UPI002617D699|nr:FecR domain-containing protein [uncultured Prevotella sp.]